MKFWNNNLKSMAEYMPGEQPDNLERYVKLNTNESPFPPAKSVIEAITVECGESLRRYPNPYSREIRHEFAKQTGLDEANFFVGNGSDEIFTLIFRAFIEKDGLAAFPYPSYSLYYVMSEANGIKYDKVPLKDDFSIDFAPYLKKKYDLVIIANPNNPTGNGFNLNEIELFLSKFKGLLVIDEAYVDFYGETSIDLVRKYDNLIITRSFSKSYSLAGLRIGVAIANKDIIRGFDKLKDSYNVDRLAQAGALAALRDTKNFKYAISMLRNNKEYLEEALEAIGFEIVPSKSNFLFAKHPKIKSKDLYEQLKEKMILVRYFSDEVSSKYVRITVGSMMEIKKLMAAINEIMGEE